MELSRSPSVENIPWYSEASLVGDNRIYRAGTLVQCLRKWHVLNNTDQATAHIMLSKAIDGRTKLGHDAVAAIMANLNLIAL